MGKQTRYVLWGQISLFGWLFICFLLMPHFLLEANEGGVSNYGVHAKTVVPYTLAFGLCASLTLRAAQLSMGQTRAERQLKRTLTFLGILFLAILLSTYPYKLNHALNSLHLGIGMFWSLSEMVLGIWFFLGLARNMVNGVLLAVQAAGFGLALLTLFGLVHVLFITEFVTSLAFGALLVRTIGAV